MDLKMNCFISMLRGINVSGQKKIHMQELRSLYEELNLVNVRTYVQSGNVVFDSLEQDASTLAEQIEALIEQTFGYSVFIFIRDRNDFQRIVTSNPFLKERNEDPSKLHVTFLYRPPLEIELSSLKIPSDEGEEFFIGDKEIFLFCPNGYGRTKWTNNYIERKLNVPATTRNWKTVNALHMMANHT